MGERPDFRLTLTKERFQTWNFTRSDGLSPDSARSDKNKASMNIHATQSRQKVAYDKRHTSKDPPTGVY